MTSGWTDLPRGAALTRWAMSDPVETLYPGVARPMPDRVDYRFVTGWVDTGPLPCREAWLAALPARQVDRPQGPFPRLVAPVEGPDVDFSAFRHRPTLIARAFRCVLRSEAAGVARFRVATCGGVHLWARDRLAGAFQPFHRNQPASHGIAVPLEPGETVLTLLLEDLHERDTTCFFSLTLLDGPPLRTRTGLEDAAAGVEDAAAALAALAPDGVFHDQGTARLVSDRPVSSPLRLRLRVQPFGRGGLTQDPAGLPEVEATLTPDAGSVALFEVEDTPAGCLSVTVTAEAGGASVSRHLGTTNLPRGTPLAGGLARRKAQAADLIAASAAFDPSVALLLALRGERPDHVDRVVGAALTTVEQRHDCSDFTLLPLLRLWRDARDRLPPATRDRLRAAILGYRYWLDEPGDDVMWFWSENHVLCFHAAQAIAGELFPDENFPNSGKTGAQRGAQARARLARWFASIDAHGLGEYNSAAYYPIDLLALLTLHDMVPDLRPETVGLLDRIFVMTGLHTTGGVPAGTQGRCYEKELLAGPATELGSVAAIAFGGTFHTGYDRAAALFCLSDYAPPEAAARFAAPAPGTWLEARYTQGVDNAGKLTVWKSAAAQLATVSGLTPGAKGHQAQVLDVQMAAHPMARLWINHPGEVKIWGERRPSLLAGSHVMPRVAQAGPTGLMVFDVDQPWTDLRFTQLFAAGAAFDPWREVHGWRVFPCGGSAVAVWCSAPLDGVAGPYRGALHRAHAARAGWVVALPLPDEQMPAFERRLAAMAPTFDPDALRLRTLGHDGRALTLDFAAGLDVDGTARAFGPLVTTPQVGWTGGDLRPWDRPAGAA